jgi:hypothetical protein
MIKDIIVHLEHQAARDPARDFAVTIAEIFDAHLAAVAFAYAATGCRYWSRRRGSTLLIVLNEKTDTSPNEIRGAEMARHLAATTSRFRS